MTAGSYLELQHHWSAVIRLLGEAAGEELEPERYRIVCIDVENVGSGAVEGAGPEVLYIAREHGNHFVPLHREGAAP